jgi:Tfp pilus assembly protein PilN
MNKYIYGALGLILLTLIAVLLYQRSELSEQELTIGLLRSEKQQCEFASKVQNERIEAYKANLEEARKTARAQEARIAQLANNKRVEVVEKLMNDDTCEQRLKLIEEQINAFCKFDN